MPDIVVCGAMILDAALDQPDIIDLQVEFSDGVEPFYFNADLVWGDGDGYIELLLSNSPVVVDETSLALMELSLRDFYHALVSCLQRRVPSRLIPNRVIYK